MKKRAISRVDIGANALVTPTATVTSPSAIAADTAQLLSNVSPVIEAVSLAAKVWDGQ